MEGREGGREKEGRGKEGREKEEREKEGRAKGGREKEEREKEERAKGGREKEEREKEERAKGGREKEERAKGGREKEERGEEVRGEKEEREKGREYTARTRVDLPPDTRTLSELTARVLISAWWPVKFCRKLPSGNFQILMLSGEAEAKQKWEVLFTTTQGVEDVEPSNSPGWREELTQRDGGPGLAHSSCGW